ncbi:hypothetical protein [Paracoccus luteus]|uniref:hypothetical protein n=1 Tax=Paracoccus luteus TaxID=2508543 RepID=UPI00106F7112|nr:hypothetical protein [Paracoccus luteus]
MAGGDAGRGGTDRRGTEQDGADQRPTARALPSGTPRTLAPARAAAPPDSAGAPGAAALHATGAHGPDGDAWATLSPLPWPHAADLRRRLAGGPQAHRGLASTHPYDVLRTRALYALADAGWTRLGVAQSSPGPASAATALNLALAAARRPDQRVALVDLDLERRPVLGLLGQTVAAPDGATRSSRSRLQANLAILSFASAPGRGSETLLAPQFHRHVTDLLAGLAPDLVVVHVPPILAGDAGIAAIEMVDTVLVAVDGTQDTAATVRGAERLVAARRPVLGLFLYDAEG